MDNINFGEKINELRMEQHKTFKQLGKQIGMSESAAVHLAKRNVFEVRLLHKIGVALKYNFFKHFPIEEENQVRMPDERDRTIEAQNRIIGERNARIAQLEKAQMELEMLRKENGFLKEINALLKKKG